VKEGTQHKSNSKPICYVCGNPAGSYRRRVNNDYSIIKCDKCGLEYTDPIPTETTLKAFYSQYKDIRADRKIVSLNAQEHLTMLVEKYGWTSESTVLDFGSGSGAFVELTGEKCYGVELQFSNNHRIKQALSELPADCSWDFITLWGVLEHLPQPKQTISNLVSLLHEGGVIALTTVDAEGVIPYYYKPPEHLSYWTRAAFDVLSKGCGLEIVEYEPYWMFQIGHIYVERLLSRTPEEYREPLLAGSLPPTVYVPTNESRVVMKKIANRPPDH
jgi:2-polyprenyl-3-methyl-5-hydroxy-6-metoxy-1,4-benzoquinol methylase